MPHDAIHADIADAPDPAQGGLNAAADPLQFVKVGADDLDRVLPLDARKHLETLSRICCEKFQLMPMSVRESFSFIASMTSGFVRRRLPFPSSLSTSGQS